MGKLNLASPNYWVRDLAARSTPSVFCAPPPALQHWPLGCLPLQVGAEWKLRSRPKLSQSGTTSRLLTAGSHAAVCQPALMPKEVPIPAVPTPFPFQKLHAKHMHVAKNKVLAHWSYLSGLYLSGLPLNSFVRNKSCFLKHEEDIQWQIAVWGKFCPPPHFSRMQAKRYGQHLCSHFTQEVVPICLIATEGQSALLHDQG